MRIDNTMTKQLKKLEKFPAPWKKFIQTFLMGKLVPFLRTAGLQFDLITQHEVQVSLKNKKRIQNHIRGVHACAMALLAETATGFVTNMNTPDDKLILLKSMHINYNRRANGDMRAVATLNTQQAEQILNQEKGNITVVCHVYDSSNQEPIEVEMIWAWIPKKK